MNSFSIFLTVVEEMNFTRAAEKLYITQQTLSGHIKRLESIYGVTLFQRRPVLRLTPEGEVMVHFARQMIDSEAGMMARFADISPNYGGKIDFGLSRQRSQVFFSGIWSSFHQSYPNISVRLHENSTKFLLEELQAGQLDLVLGLNVPHTGNLEVTDLTREYNCCLINELLLERFFPDSWREMLVRFQREGVSLMEIRAMPLVLFPDTNAIRRKVNRVFYQGRAMPNVILETNEQGVIFNVACYGDAVGILTPAAVYNRIVSKESLPSTCHLFRLADMPVNTLSVVTRSDVSLPKHVLELKKAVSEEFGYYNAILEEVI